MARTLRRAKGNSGQQSVLYRHIDGQIYDAYITGFQAAALATPGAPTVTPIGTTGAQAYSYRIVARNSSGVTLAGTAGTTATGNATLSATNYNQVTWTAVPGAESYDVYGRTAGTELFIANTTATTYNDQTNAAPSGALPGANTTAAGYNVRVPQLKTRDPGRAVWSGGVLTVTPHTQLVPGGLNRIAAQVATSRTQTGVIFNPGAKP